MYEKERLEWISKTLRERYGETVTTGQLAQEFHTDTSTMCNWMRKVGLHEKRASFGHFPVDEVTQAIVFRWKPIK